VPVAAAVAVVGAAAQPPDAERAMEPDAAAQTRPAEPQVPEARAAARTKQAGQRATAAQPGREPGALAADAGDEEAPPRSRSVYRSRRVRRRLPSRS
jgi:hypothetical protein